MGAEVRIDAELVGKTPVVREGVAAGDHVVELRLKDYDIYKETIKVEGGREKLFSIDLKKSGPSAEQMQRRKQGMSSFGARVNPVGGVTADFGVGYPYYLTVRATVGAFNVKPLGFDMGIEFQTHFDLYNLSVHGRLQLVEAGPLSVAVRANMGGGSGVKGRDTYFMDLSAVASLAFGSVATFSGTLRYSAWTDKFCPTSTQRNNGVGASDFCGDPNLGTDYDHTLFSSNPNTNRYSGSRMYAGIAAVAAIDRYMSVFLQIEFLPFPSQFSLRSAQGLQGRLQQRPLRRRPLRLRNGRRRAEVLGRSLAPPPQHKRDVSAAPVPSPRSARSAGEGRPAHVGRGEGKRPQILALDGPTQRHPTRQSSPAFSAGIRAKFSSTYAPS